MESTAEETLVEWRHAIMRTGWRSALLVAAAKSFLHIAR